MKLKEGFVPYQAEDTHMLVAMGKTKFSGIVRNNETAAFIVDHLREDISENTLATCMMERYGIDEETARRGVKTVLDTLRKIDALDE